MTTDRPPPPSERVSFGGLLIVSIILIAFALVALYSNVQKWRNDKIEKVIVTRIPTPTPSPR
jgi:hypothetical protein